MEAAELSMILRMQPDDPPETSTETSTETIWTSTLERWVQARIPYREQNLTPAQRQELANGFRWARGSGACRNPTGTKPVLST